jgi:hypothetical protein
MLKGNSAYKGQTMKQMVKTHLAPVNSSGINYTVTTSLSPNESRTNYAIQRNLSTKNFMGNVVTRVELPHDTDKSQLARTFEERRQLAMPWQNHFMHTDTDGKRLNNPAQKSAVSQRQLVPANTYGQFYAFMHALSAAFGTLQQG